MSLLPQHSQSRRRYKPLPSVGEFFLTPIPPNSPMELNLEMALTAFPVFCDKMHASTINTLLKLYISIVKHDVNVMLIKQNMVITILRFHEN